MRKFVVFVTVLVLAIVALRQFGSTLGKRAVTKCQEMMARHAGAPGDRSLAEFDRRTELAGTQS